MSMGEKSKRNSVVYSTRVTDFYHLCLVFPVFPFDRLTTVMDLHLDREAVEAEKKSAKEKQELLTLLASQIPRTTKDLFRYPIEWELLHKHQIFTLKVEPWISKKVAEFLGESEPELAAFISKRVGY